jgi:hypothetical protein
MPIRFSSPPGGPSPILDLFASAHSAGLTCAGALFPPPVPAGLQLSLEVPPRLRRPGQPQDVGPAWPITSGLPARPPVIGGDLLVDHDAALVVRGLCPEGLSSVGRWYLVFGRRQHVETQAGPQTFGGPQNAGRQLMECSSPAASLDLGGDSGAV